MTGLYLHSTLLCILLLDSPAKLNECETRPLFVVYQLLEAARDTQDRGLHLGDITLRHLFIDDALYLSLLPSITDSLIRPEFSRPCRREKVNEFSRKNGVSDTLMLTLDSSMCQGEGGNHAVVNISSSQQAEGSVDALGAPSPGGKKGGSSSDCSPLLSDTISDESANFCHNCHSYKGLVGYQKLLSSDEAFDILKKVSTEKMCFLYFLNTVCIQYLVYFVVYMVLYVQCNLLTPMFPFLSEFFKNH